MRILKISIISFISHARDGFKKIYKYKILDWAKNKWLASHTSKHWSKMFEKNLPMLARGCYIIIGILIEKKVFVNFSMAMRNEKIATNCLRKPASHKQVFSVFSTEYNQFQS